MKKSISHRQAHSMAYGRPWSDEEVARAVRMHLDEHMTWAEIGQDLGRLPQAVESKIAQACRLELRRRGIDVSRTVPHDVEAKRERLILARLAQPPTSALLGDPPPGWSALDRGRG